MSFPTTSRSNGTATGPPYLPRNQFAGGFPTEDIDIPVSSVFILLFLLGAISFMSILLRNLRRGHKFIMSGMMFGFCMARIVTMSMRIAWAVYPDNARIALAAQIFVSAGIVFLFIINLVFSQRILRACLPSFGWSRILSWGFLFLYFTILATLAILVTSIVQIYHTLDRSIIAIDISMQRFGLTYFLIISALPFLFIATALFYPRKGPIDNFGIKSIYRKMVILTISAALLTIGAAWRASNGWRGQRPFDKSTPWYLSRTSFYIFNFALEFSIICIYILFRVDKVFYIPDGAKGPGSYNLNRHLGGQSQPTNKEETAS